MVVLYVPSKLSQIPVTGLIANPIIGTSLQQTFFVGKRHENLAHLKERLFHFSINMSSFYIFMYKNIHQDLSQSQHGVNYLLDNNNFMVGLGILKKMRNKRGCLQPLVYL